MDIENTLAAEPTLSVEYKLKLKHISHKRKPKPRPSKTVKKLPHVTRLLALAHHLQDLVEKGTVNDYADIAKLSNLSRARLSQIMNLTLLASEIQEEILLLEKNTPPRKHLKEKTLRLVLKTPDWKKQIEIWRELRSS